MTSSADLPAADLVVVAPEDMVVSADDLPAVDMATPPDLPPSLMGFPSHVSAGRHMESAADLANVTAIHTGSSAPNDDPGVSISGGAFAVPPGTAFVVENGRAVLSVGAWN